VTGPPAPVSPGGAAPPLLAPRCCKLLVNRRAGRNATHPVQSAAIIRAYERLGEVSTVEALSGLDALLRRWKDEGVDLLALSGGDGTMQRALEAMLRIWGTAPLPRLLFLDGGTAGLVPRSAGVGSSLDAVARVGVAIETGRPVPVRAFPTLRVGGRPAFTVAIGSFKRMAEEYVVRGRRGGGDLPRLGFKLFGSWLACGPFAARMLEPLSYDVQLDGEEVAPGGLTGVHISVLDRFLGAAYRRLDLGRRDLRVVALAPMTRSAMVGGLLPFGLGVGPLPRAMRVTAASGVTLRADSPIRYMADGEFYEGEGPLRIEPGIELSVVRWTGKVAAV